MVTADAYEIATGGDDTAICVLHLLFKMKNATQLEVETLKQWKLERAHAAQVTGIPNSLSLNRYSGLLPHVLSLTLSGVKFVGCDKLVSASVDQRIILWCRSEANDGAFPWQWVSCYHCNVADVTHLDAWLDWLVKIFNISICRAPIICYPTTRKIFTGTLR